MTLDDLAQLIDARKSADPDSSWTAKLLAKGPEKCAEKFGEEAIEAIIEAVKGDKAALTSEAADVLYHLLVMLAASDVALGDVMAELDAPPRHIRHRRKSSAPLDLFQGKICLSLGLALDSLKSATTFVRLERPKMGRRPILSPAV